MQHEEAKGVKGPDGEQGAPEDERAEARVEPLGRKPYQKRQGRDADQADHEAAPVGGDVVAFVADRDHDAACQVHEDEGHERDLRPQHVLVQQDRHEQDRRGAEQERLPEELPAAREVEGCRGCHGLGRLHDGPSAAAYFRTFLD
ncbi:MAG: hypothetical protein ABR562_07205 [Thermoplasmatota archaeon]